MSEIQPAPAPATGWKRNFFIIWSGQAISLVGSSLVGFGLVWWLTQTTGSAAVLATASLANLLPGVFLGPFAGALVDRWNRRKVMLIADSAVALLTAVLVALFWAGLAQPWHVYIILFLRSLSSSFHWPAMQASTSLMVPKEQLTRIAGMNQTLNGALSILTPPLGALLIGILPMHTVLAMDIFTMLFAVVPLLFITIPQPPIAGAGQSAPPLVTPRLVLRDVRDGLRYVMGWKGLAILLFMAMALNFVCAPTGTLQPLLITQEFNGGPWHIGAMESAWGIGMIAGGLLLSAWGGFKRRILTSMVGLLGLGAGVALTGLAPSHWFWLALVGSAVTGVGNPITNGPLMAIIQARVAPEMQGRVLTMIQSLAGGMMPLSMLVSAPIADAFGVRVWFLAAAVVCVLMGLVGPLIPALMRIEEDPIPGAPEPVPALNPLHVK